MYRASHRRVVIEAGFVEHDGVVTECAPILKKRVLGMELDKALATLRCVGYEVTEVPMSYRLDAAPKAPKRTGLFRWLRKR